MTLFDDLAYLRAGTDKQQRAYRALTENAVLEKLDAYTPLLAGTIPLAIDIDTSDLDILCYWTDKHRFIDTLIHHFSDELQFMLQEKVMGDRETVLASFTLDGFQIEIFSQNRPVKEQEAYRHLVVEHEVLTAYGEDFRKAVITLKKAGVKTEPAFAQVLGLQGDPYLALLDYKVSR